MTRAGEAQRRRLNDTFVELCRIESPFGRERACGDRVAGELRGLGLEVQEDGSGPEAGSESGNLLARVPGPAERTILLCAHLDTVVPQAPIEPELDDGRWQNARDGILGADNKAAVAVILEVARHAVEQGAPVGLELLFTVCEENALRGAKAFDVGRLRSGFGYVFDHATAIGEVVVASPTYYRLDAEFRGAAAHAGIRPEDGRSAIAAAARAVADMRLGRIDPETTANVGRIEGGSASLNVVPERCRIEAEARSLDDGKVESLIAEMVDRVHDGANAAECDVDVEVQRLFSGYRVRPSSAALGAAEAALRACGYEPRRIVTGGGSDANALEAAGFHCVNLANGTERNHQPDEGVTVAALEGMLDVALALLDAAAQC
ncbi:MAG: M20/M25/M40 family metallo-hydrolase [Actinobacteria bacterium]|nr:MAG: M20/M25/M40 family metallo-hydrolase [Actinomycetota bacterium]